jgi:hypothetical protein
MHDASEAAKPFQGDRYCVLNGLIAHDVRPDECRIATQTGCNGLSGIGIEVGDYDASAVRNKMLGSGRA